MPRIFDNIEADLLTALRETLDSSKRADFCVGYFNLRGWSSLADLVELYAGTDESCCRVLIGMHRAPEEVMREMQKAARLEQELDKGTKLRLKKRIAQSFKEQIEFGLPTAAAEKTLRQLAKQLRAHKVCIKLFLKHPLHAKLYLLHRTDPIAPLVAYLGSSNLTLSGLSHQGELNVDVVEKDAADKLQRWFDVRWDDEDGFDLSDELAELIENSWASDKLVNPYLVYLKMAYHLSEDARIGERDFKLPKVFQGVLLDFQVAAVQLASRLLYKNGGVLVADVVGLGKTLMASAIARIFQEDDGSNVLIICPPKLAEMWTWYKGTYGLAAEIVSLGAVTKELPNLPPYRLVLMDESHNLRNREGKRYRAIQEYIEKCNSRVILLTATPYNKQFADLSNQLRLFVDEDADLRVRPEQFFQQWQKDGFTEAEFLAQYQASPRSLRAFELSDHSEGRVDRIGQKHDTILAYSFLPAEGVDRIIRLRSRLMDRLIRNQEVVGTDETFIGEEASKRLHDLYYTEKGVLDDDADEEVDLASFAQQVWNTATEANQKACRTLPPVVPASRAARVAEPKTEPEPPGLVTYLRFPDGTDALVRVDDSGKVVSQSISAIFRSSACAPDTPTLPLAAKHYDLLAQSVQAAHEEQVSLSGQLGSFRSTRRKLYERLKNYREKLKSSPTLFSPQVLKKLEPLLNTLLRSPLKESASDSLRRQMRLGVSDESLTENVLRLQEEERLCQVTEVKETPEPQILCSLGIQPPPTAQP